MIIDTSVVVMPLARNLKAFLIFLIGNLTVGSFQISKRTKDYPPRDYSEPRQRAPRSFSRAQESGPRQIGTVVRVIFELLSALPLSAQRVYGLVQPAPLFTRGG
ncbi:hypothetical protein [Roseovarius sp. TM1035]|jgi:hypothetical protein|uniref:hypothetical protein n=1 Tax=Roseovarius sp. TM1035 TaxID=391613 RepID=UPI0018DD2BCF|nr:hypothetical protein [Roseovarius sp. TM1035]